MLRTAARKPRLIARAVALFGMLRREAQLTFSCDSPLQQLHPADLCLDS